MDDRFIYQKKDFVNIGVKPGSFSRLLKTLDLEQPEYMTIKQLGNGINAKFFTQEAMEKVVQYLEEKKKAGTSTELVLIQQNTELKQQVQQLQNAVALLESRHTQELTAVKEEWHKKETEYIKENADLKQVAKSKEDYLNSMEDWSIWKFRTWKKVHRDLRIAKELENKKKGK